LGSGEGLPQRHGDAELGMRLHNFCMFASGKPSISSAIVYLEKMRREKKVRSVKFEEGGENDECGTMNRG